MTWRNQKKTMGDKLRRFVGISLITCHFSHTSNAFAQPPSAPAAGLLPPVAPSSFPSSPENGKKEDKQLLSDAKEKLLPIPLPTHTSDSPSVPLNPTANPSLKPSSQNLSPNYSPAHIACGFAVLGSIGTISGIKATGKQKEFNLNPQLL
ncbi:hypothetical protein [Pajaroellobacter abortibovis]|nr:hypothetical protein [Pajaroellobacter abortibovis]